MPNDYLFDDFIADINYIANRLKGKFSRFFAYRKFARNWLEVFFYRAIRKYPFAIITFDNKRIVIKDERSWMNYIINEIYKNLIYDKFKIRISNLERTGPLAILNEDYKFLVNPGNYIVDIGANIGDTALYFWHHGMKVLGFEPYPILYKFALENIKLNKAKEIKIIRAAIGKKNGFIILENDLNARGESSLKISKKGVKTPVYSLATVIKRFKVPKDANLKIDCEGCEYDIIIYSSDETLRHFKRIQMEYHYGRENLEERLKKAGFKVRSTWLTEILNKARSEIKNAWSKSIPTKRSNVCMRTGYIYAKRIDD